MEMRLRWDPALGELFVGWHNLEAFSFSTAKRAQYYVKVWSDWTDYERCALLFTAIPPVLAYHSLIEGGTLKAIVRAIA